MPQTTVRVLILGGTRFIGPAVVLRLLQHGCEVALFHRGKTGAGLFAHLVHILGDRQNLPDFRAQFTSFCPDVVIDMAPLSEAHARTVMETFAGMAPRVVTISSCDVYRAYGKLIGRENGQPDAVPLSEDSPLRSFLFPYRGKAERLYDYEKILVEKITTESTGPLGTVLRLPMVYGPRDYQHRLWPHLKRMRDNRPFIVLESAHANWRVSRAYVEDVAEAIALAVIDDGAAGRIYNVAEPECYTERDWIERIGRAVGWNGEVIDANGAEFPELVEEGFHPSHDLVVDSGRIRSELSYREVVDPERALRITIDWEYAHPPDTDPVPVTDYETEDAVIARLKRVTPQRQNPRTSTLPAVETQINHPA